MGEHRVIQAEVPWEYYVDVYDNTSAIGHVYLGKDLIYRCNVSGADIDLGDDFTPQAALEVTQSNFAHTLWRVLADAQPVSERGQ